MIAISDIESFKQYQNICKKNGKQCTKKGYEIMSKFDFCLLLNMSPDQNDPKKLPWNHREYLIKDYTLITACEYLSHKYKSDGTLTKEVKYEKH